MNKFFERIFDRWTKWELIEEHVAYDELVSHFGGPYVKVGRQYFDVYRRTNKFTGLRQTKKVVVS